MSGSCDFIVMIIFNSLQGCHEESSTELDQRTLEDVVGRSKLTTFQN